MSCFPIFFQPFFFFFFGSVLLSSCFGLFLKTPKENFFSSLFPWLPYSFFFGLLFHEVIVFFALVGIFYSRAVMNQRLLAWHGMKAGMDDERKEGRRWAEGGGGKGGKVGGTPW